MNRLAFVVRVLLFWSLVALAFVVGLARYPRTLKRRRNRPMLLGARSLRDKYEVPLWL